MLHTYETNYDTKNVIHTKYILLTSLENLHFRVDIITYVDPFYC